MMAAQNGKQPGKVKSKKKTRLFSMFNSNVGIFDVDFTCKPNRVFKKSSSNGKITVYLGKRDFVDHISHVDPIGKLHFLKIYLFFEREFDLNDD